MDAFWGLETSTVLGKFGRLRQDYFGSIKVLSIRIPVATIFTSEVRHRVIMVCEIQTLDDLKRRVKRQDQLQWDSMRMTPTWYNNSWEAGVVSSEAGDIYSSNDKKVYTSAATKASIWF